MTIKRDRFWLFALLAIVGAGMPIAAHAEAPLMGAPDVIRVTEITEIPLPELRANPAQLDWQAQLKALGITEYKVIKGEPISTYQICKADDKQDCEQVDDPTAGDDEEDDETDEPEEATEE
jgi:hypothetical protein